MMSGKARARSARRWPHGRPLVIGAAAVAAFALAACGSSSGSSGSSGSGGSDAPSGPITIGIIAPLSGADAGLGAPDAQGAAIAVQLVNASGGVLGQKIRVKEADDQATGSGAVTALRTLSSDDVHLMVAGNTTPECSAMIPLLASLKVVQLPAGCASDDLTGSGVNPWYFRSYGPAGPEIEAFTKWMCQHFSGIKTVDHMTPNYDFGQFQLKSVNTGFQSACGVTSGNTVLASITATSASSYVASLLAHRASNAKQSSVLDLSTFGPALTSAVKIGGPEGLFTGYRAVFTTSGPAYTTELPTFGSGAPSVYVASDYTYLNTGGLSQSFRTAFKAKYHTEPSAEAGQVFGSIEALVAAIKKAKSADPDKVRQAMAGLTYTATQANPVTINAATHQGNPDFHFLHFVGQNATLVGSAAYPTS
jgi:branched-chain amino acid transport system substrate-binding protein